MLGAIIGDISGSRFEWENHKSKDFDLFYPLGFTLEQIRPDYGFDVSCRGSVPQAIEAFLESTGFEDAIRNAVSIGGDSDTIAAMTGSIAEAYYGIPSDIRQRVLRFLDENQMSVIDAFEQKYGNRIGGQ